MQGIFLLILVVFSIGMGFFMGVLLLSLSPTLSKRIMNSFTNIVDEVTPSSTPQSAELQLSGIKKPNSKAKLLLQVWQVEDDTILYGIKGEYVEEGDLSEELASLLEPVKKAQDSESISDFFKGHEVKPSEELEDKEEEEEDLEPLSLINEINEILQEKLMGSSLSHKGIRLTENQKNEITIWVGLKSYSSIEAVPDPDIQEIIQESVKEWEEHAE